MKRKFKLKKINFEGMIHIVESIFGLLLTISIFATILNKESINEIIAIPLLGLFCVFIDIWAIYLSIKMKKRTCERASQLERHPNQQTGISSKILILEKKSKYISTIKLAIESVSLYFFMLT